MTSKKLNSSNSLVVETFWKVNSLIVVKAWDQNYILLGNNDADSNNKMLSSSTVRVKTFSYENHIWNERI